MSLAAGQDDADGYEPVPPRPGQAAARPAAAMFRRRSAQPSRRGVLHLQTASDGPVPSDLARWYTERGFHFYVAALRWPGQPGRPRRRGRRALAAAFAELDARCEHLRAGDGIENVIVTAHGEGAMAAALWCARRPAAEPAASQHPAADPAQPAGRTAGGRPDALILYAPVFGRRLRRGLDVPCPVLVIGEADSRLRPGRRADPAVTLPLGRHVTWLRPTDARARPDAEQAQDRSRFFDEMGRWLGAYMYGQARDQLL